jgi:deoxyribodipyrimidine photo-lyase
VKWSNDSLLKLLQPDTVVFWFRRDLRLQDNAGFYHALKENKNVIPLFIFDTCILNELEEKNDRRVNFIFQTLHHLKAQLEEHGSTLIVLHGDPLKIFQSIHSQGVYTNHDFEPYARRRDDKVQGILSKKGIAFKNYKDHVIFEKNEVTKEDGHPYTVFTPYSRRWKATLNKSNLKSYPTEKYLTNLKKIRPVAMPSLADIGFDSADAAFPERVIKTSIIKRYHETRDYPGIRGTSRLSVHLRFGTVSIRKLVQIARKENETWLNELIWRDFYAMILWHFPQVEKKSFKPAYDRIAWRNHPVEFENWCMGKTGYPIVDAGMRELNETGFMHNRVRMITASFLVKHLLIDWRWGEAYFAKKLLDFDLASNNGGWQWAASCGCDAAPYFRVFNPELQAEKFDKDFRYIKQWVPEFGTPDYVKPIVDHKMARERAIKVYQAALAG